MPQHEEKAMPTAADADRALRNLAGIRYRIDHRVLDGRNGAATERAVDAHLRTLRAYFAECDETPADERRWTRFTALERWSVGL
jgi:hypothetical protein